MGGRRHSKEDHQRIRRVREIGRELDQLAVELGDEDWQDDDGAGKRTRTTKAASLNQQIEQVSRAIYAQLGPLEAMAYVRDVYEDHAIVCLYDERARVERLYRADYTVAEDGAVAVAPRGEWAEVEVTYQPVGTRTVQDLVLRTGGAVKATGVTADGGLKVTGYLVRFGSPDQTDLDGMFFTKDTDFDFADGDTTAVYFHHRLPLKTRDGGFIVVKDKIGTGTLKAVSDGVLIDAVIYNREQYEAMLAKLGWSSGTAEHLIETETVGKAIWIKRWPLKLDASLTPTPAEPRAQAVPVKALSRPEAAPQVPQKGQQGATAPHVVIIRRHPVRNL